MIRPYLKIFIAVAIVTVFGAAIFIFLYKSNTQDSPQTSISTNTQTSEYAPPTNSEESAGDEIKQDIIDKQSDQQNGPAPKAEKKTVGVAVTDASQYDNIIEVRAFVPNHLENGECEIVFSRQNLTVTRTTPAYTDATTTICTNPVIERSEFPSSGEWQLTVQYTSESAEGTSETQEVVIN